MQQMHRQLYCVARQLNTQRPLAEEMAEEESRRRATQDQYGRVQHLRVNVNHWKQHALQKHECHTCQRRFKDQNEQNGFIKHHVRMQQNNTHESPRCCCSPLSISCEV